MFPWKRAIIERGLKLLTQRLNYSQREKDVGDFVTVEYQYTLILNVCSRSCSGSNQTSFKSTLIRVAAPGILRSPSVSKPCSSMWPMSWGRQKKTVIHLRTPDSKDLIQSAVGLSCLTFCSMNGTLVPGIRFWSWSSKEVRGTPNRPLSAHKYINIRWNRKKMYRYVK